jgi:HAD superfamily hydrolase (TIGR01509 family)
VIEELVLCHSPSGVEGEVNRYIQQWLDNLDVEYWQDEADNIVIKIPGRTSDGAVAVTAHKDEIGALVKGIEAGGKLQVRRLGGAYPWAQQRHSVIQPWRYTGKSSQKEYAMQLTGSENLANRTCWVFDMDGTLTLGIHDFEAIRTALELPAEEPILESLRKLPPDIAAEKHEKLRNIELDLARQATVQPGAHKLLELLINQGKQIAILTRNGKDIAHETLNACGLMDFFDPTLVLSRDCHAPKPEPDGILALLETWEASPTNAVMVGDYKFDLVAGQRAGTATVYIDTAGEFIWSAYADYGVRSLQSVVSWLNTPEKIA